MLGAQLGGTNAGRLELSIFVYKGKKGEDGIVAARMVMFERISPTHVERPAGVVFQPGQEMTAHLWHGFNDPVHGQPRVVAADEGFQFAKVADVHARPLANLVEPAKDVSRGG